LAQTQTPHRKRKGSSSRNLQKRTVQSDNRVDAQDPVVYKALYSPGQQNWVKLITREVVHTARHEGVQKNLLRTQHKWGKKKIDLSVTQGMPAPNNLLQKKKKIRVPSRGAKIQNSERRAGDSAAQGTLGKAGAGNHRGGRWRKEKLTTNEPVGPSWDQRENVGETGNNGI